MKIGYYEELSCHLEVLGAFIEILQEEHELVVYNNGDKSQWLEYYKNLYNIKSKNIETIFTDYQNLDMIIVGTSFETKKILEFNNSDFNNKCVYVCHLQENTANFPDNKVFVLSPLNKTISNTYIFPIISKNMHEKSIDKLRIGIVGRFKKDNRDVSDLLKLLDSDYDNYEIIIYSRHPKFVPQVLKDKQSEKPHILKIKYRVSTEKMLRDFTKISYLWPLIQKGSEYHDDRLSGALPLGFNLNTPLILDKTTADIYEIESAKIYNNSILEIFDSIYVHNNDSYSNIIHHMENERNMIIGRNKTNMESFFFSSSIKSKPQESKLQESKLQESKPQESKLQESKLQESKPQESKLQESKLQESKLQESKPQESKPQESKPQESKPQESKLQESKPQESKPQESKPQESKPQESKPQESKPQESKLQESKPQEEIRVEDKLNLMQTHIGDMLEGIPVYWINRSNNDLSRFFSNNGIDATEIRYIQIDEDEIKEFKRLSDQRLSGDDIMNTLSHIQLLQKVYEDNCEYAIVFEDNISFDFMNYINIPLKRILQGIPKKTVIQLSYEIYDITKRQNYLREASDNNLFIAENHPSTTCYIIYRDYVKYILNTYKNNFGRMYKILYSGISYSLTVPYFTRGYENTEEGKRYKIKMQTKWVPYLKKYYNK